MTRNVGLEKDYTNVGLNMTTNVGLNMTTNAGIDDYEYGPLMNTNMGLSMSMNEGLKSMFLSKRAPKYSESPTTQKMMKTNISNL